MNYYLFIYRLSLILTALTSFLLGALVLIKAYRNKTARIFSAFTISVALWSYLQAQMSFAATAEGALILGKLLQLFVIIIPCVFLHFTYSIVENEEKNSKIILFSYLGLIGFSLFLPTRLFVPSVRFEPEINYMINPGLVYHLFMVYYAITVGLSFINLLNGYRKSSGLKANQLKYVLAGTFIGFFSATSNFLYVYDRTVPVFNPYINFGVSIYALIITYAILKHRLMDINLIFRKTLIYGLTYSSCLAVFGFIVIFLGHRIFARNIDKKMDVTYMLAVFVIVLIVKPLDKLLTMATDKFLFRKKYEYHKTLKEASEGMIRVRKIDKLLNLIVNIIVKHVRVRQASVFLLDKNTNNFVVKASRGKLKIPKDYLKISIHNTLIRYLNRINGPIVCEELKQILKQGPDSLMLGVIQEMERLQVSVCVPSFLKGKLIGLLLLGEKLSGDMYSQEDLSLFSTLSIQAALAIENAQAYEALSEAKDKLFEAEKLASIGRLAGGIAHEIKNPLASIKTFTEYLNEKFDDAEFRRKFQRIVGSEVDRINHIVEQLIFYAHPKSANLKETDIHKIIGETLSLLENDLEREKIKIQKEFSRDCPLLYSDPQQLKQVFLNLFLNSIQAMHDNKEKIRELRISTHKEDEQIRIIVSDTGKGIPAEQMPVIFEPFFTTKEKGSGLGLAIVKSIVEGHQGKISVRSEPRKETSFFVSLPFSLKRASQLQPA